MSPDALKRFRSDNNLSQKGLADKLGVSVHAVQSWEQGKNPIPPSVEKHLLAVMELKVPIELLAEISEFAQSAGMSFDEALFAAIREGLAARKRGK